MYPRRDSLPRRPAKLTPIYSKKRAEITNFDEPPPVEERRKTGRKKRSSIASISGGIPPPPPPPPDSHVKEIPANPIDFIWDTDNMLPRKEDLTDHSKTTLGGTVAKLDENDRITTIGSSLES